MLNRQSLRSILVSGLLLVTQTSSSNYRPVIGHVNDELLLAKMIFNEARGCSDFEKIAVAYTPINRMSDGLLWNGEENLRDVLLSPNQYAVSTRALKSNPYLINDPVFNRCLQISRSVLSGEIQDPTSGATSFFEPRKVRKGYAEKLRRKEREGLITFHYLPQQTRHVFYRNHK